MRKLNAILNDYPCETKSIICFSDDDFKKVDNTWSCPNDPQLMKLQSLECFAGYTRWSDVTPDHFRLLIMRLLQIVSKLDEVERTDSQRLEVGALSFLILAYVRCLELRTGSTIEIFKINVLSALNVSFSFHAEVELAFEPPKPMNPFSIVVDNTDD